MIRAVAIAAGAVAVLVPVVLIGAASASPDAYRDAPPPGFSSGFGEQSCHACHFAREPNLPPGRLELRGVPERYSPGATYPITVFLTNPVMAAAGFQLTARFTDDGRQAGSLARAPSDSTRVAITISYDIAYAHQLRPGSAPAAPDTASWTVLWTAPATGRGVSFHAAANAADGDDTVDGDVVHTTSATSSGPARHPH
ncbi:MAG: choice-of-anchor V domain-containing protein [Gemmatimonadota bacterium]